MKDFINTKTLSAEELVSLRGGDSSGYFYCICGFSGRDHGDCFPVMADDIYEALSVATSHCGGPGNTCNGEECPPD